MRTVNLTDNLKRRWQLAKHFFQETNKADFWLDINKFARSMTKEFFQIRLKKKNQKEVIKALRKIYNAQSRAIALKRFKDFKNTGAKAYPKVISSFERDLEQLLNFLTYLLTSLNFFSPVL